MSTQLDVDFQNHHNNYYSSKFLFFSKQVSSLLVKEVLYSLFLSAVYYDSRETYLAVVLNIHS